MQRFAASAHGVGVVLVRSDAQDNGVFRDDGIEMPLDVPASLSVVSSTSTSEMDESLTRWKGIPERVPGMLQGKCTLSDARGLVGLVCAPSGVTHASTVRSPIY